MNETREPIDGNRGISNGLRPGWLNTAGPYIALSVIAVLLFFGRSFTNYFVADDFYFLGRVNLGNAGAYLSESWGYGNEYRPLAAYSYAINGALSGSSPVGYHVTNTAIHGMNALLIGGLALLLGLSPSVALIACLIFLLNPVGHESVLWIAGRPVLLGAFFVLTSCCGFMKGALDPQSRRWAWIVAYAALVLAFGSYEVAVVTPFLWILGSRLAGKRNALHSWIPFCAGLGITAIYILLWNWLFDFHINRFPIETSPNGAFLSLVQALLHAFHGSLRPEVGVIYVLLMGFLCARPNGALTVLACLGWFVLAYVPFLLVPGYADRFAYLSSAAVAVLLATAIHELVKTWRIPGRIVLLCLLTYLAAGMQKRISTWKEAGNIARTIPAQIKELVPSFPADDHLLVLLNIPQSYKQAYVYLSGLDRALQLEYPDAHIKFTMQVRPWANEDSTILEYVDGRMVRTQFNDVRDRYP